MNGVIRFFETQNLDVYVKSITLENITAFSFHPFSKCVSVHTTGKKVLKYRANDESIHFKLIKNRINHHQYDCLNILM